MHQTLPSCPDSTFRQTPISSDHRRTVLSELPVATKGRLKVTQLTSSVCPVNVRTVVEPCHLRILKILFVSFLTEHNPKLRKPCFGKKPILEQKKYQSSTTALLGSSCWNLLENFWFLTGLNQKLYLTSWLFQG